ncbi:MAG: hypothetical protein ACFNTA_11055 [Campylobacter sp.]
MQCPYLRGLTDDALFGAKLSEDKICGEAAGRLKFKPQGSNLQKDQI